MATFGVARAAVLLCACHAAEPIALPPAPGAAADPSQMDEPLPGAVQSLGLGMGYSCALTREGGVKCWGSDEYGVLGQDTLPRDISDPSSVGPLQFGDARRVLQLSAGWYHVCVLFDDGHARCWGRNERGQLGRGDTEDYGDDAGETLDALSDIPLERVIQISAGVSNTCALVRAGQGLEGTVHCFGSDVDGAIGDTRAGDFGDDEPVDALRPAALMENATQVLAGDAVNCARLSSGAVQCWGSNAFGTLGIGPDPCSVSEQGVCARSRSSSIDDPVKNLVGRFITGLELNQAHACALDNRGELSCWGRNDQSRAGYPHTIYGNVLRAPPGRVSLGAEVHVISVGLGTRHGCALDTQGDVRCWGEAGPQLGYAMPRQDGVAGVGGTEEPSQQYALMDHQGVVQLGDTDAEPGPDRALRSFSGGQHNCAIMASGAVRCWGRNGSGELGYGDFSVIGDIGGEQSPADAYDRLQRYDVCITGQRSSLTTSCAN